MDRQIAPPPDVANFDRNGAVNLIVRNIRNISSTKKEIWFRTKNQLGDPYTRPPEKFESEHIEPQHLHATPTGYMAQARSNLRVEALEGECDSRFPEGGCSEGRKITIQRRKAPSNHLSAQDKTNDNALRAHA